MADPLGAWSNAPLVYALAEVRTEHLADIKNYQPIISGQLRDDYPLQRMVQGVKVAIGSTVVLEPDQDLAWEFATPDNRTAVIVRPTGILLHATAYIDSRNFLSRLQRAIDVFAKVVPAVYVNRLGLRYIDFVLPREGEEPEAYVDRRLNPDLGLSKQAGGIKATSLAIYGMEGGPQVMLRYIRAFGKPEIPPELKMLSLDPSPLMNRDDVKKDQPTAIVDTDCSIACAPVERLDPARVQQQLASIYKVSFDAFMAAVTDHARKVWGAV